MIATLALTLWVVTFIAGGIFIIVKSSYEQGVSDGEMKVRRENLLNSRPSVKGYGTVKKPRGL